MTIRERIHGELVSLTPLDVEAAATWAVWMNDPQTARYLFSPGDAPSGPFTPEEELEWGRRALADPVRVMFGIEDRTSGQLIGHARLTPERRRRATFGIVIGDAPHRGRGRGREATAMVCRYGFEELGLREVRLTVDRRNEPAIRAYEAVGFTWTGPQTMRLERTRAAA